MLHFCLEILQGNIGIIRLVEAMVSTSKEYIGKVIEAAKNWPKETVGGSC